MLAIYKREFKSHFTGMSGYLFLAVFTFFIGLYANFYNFVNALSQIDYVINSITFVFIIVVPVLTMGTLAGERRQKTDQLLLTSPVSVTRIIIEKFFALLSVFALTVLLLCLYPLLFSFFGHVNFAQAYAKILSFLLLGGALIAVGMFISSITENSIVAAVSTLAVMILMFFMSYIGAQMAQSSIVAVVVFTAVVALAGTSVYSMTKHKITALIVAVALEAVILVLFLADAALLKAAFSALLNWLWFFKYFDNGTIGLFDITGVVYYLSVIFFFLFLSIQAIEKRRWS